MVEKRLKRVGRFLLQKYFGFEKWHISLLENRPYAIEVIDFLNNRSNKGVVAEIGCGLGDIVRNLNFKNKVGLDIEEAVLNATRFLSHLNNKGGDLKLRCFDFTKDNLAEKCDAIVMVNWIHNIDPGLLRKRVTELFGNNLKNDGVLIFDVIENEKYRFNHNVEYLTQDVTGEVNLMGPYQYGRTIVILKKN